MGLFYWMARGEILWFIQEKQKRKHQTILIQSIKNEGMGIEKDQIPLYSIPVKDGD